MSKIIEEKISLIDSAMGPVAVKTTTIEGFNVDDFVKTTIESKAQFLRLKNKAALVNPLDVNNRPPVELDDVSIGGYDGF
jgi:uncharacterized protein YqkB